MKYLQAIICFLTLIMIMTLPAWAAELKIGFIDTQKIFQEFKGAQDIQKQLDKEVEDLRKEEQGRKHALDSLRTDYEKQKLLLSENRRKDLEAEIKAKQDDYETFVQSVWGDKGKIAQRTTEIVRPVVEKINTIVRKIGEDEGYALILDAADGNLVYAPRKADLTEDVLAELNKEFGIIATPKGGRRRIIFYAFLDKTPDAERAKLGRTFSLTLRTAFAAPTYYERFNPLPRDTVDDYLKKQNFDPNIPLAENKAIDQAKGMAGDLVVLGSVSKLGSEIEATVRVMEVATGKRLVEETGRARDEKGLLDMATDLADRLVKKMQL